MQNQALTGYPSVDKPWLKYYSQEEINVALPECTMYEHIVNCNKDNLDRIALDYYGTKISYGKMFEEISYLAGTLETSGIKEGDIVTVCMVNSPETILLIFALNKIGAVANMVCSLNSSKELTDCITNAKSRIVFTLDTFQGKFEQIADAIRAEKIIVAKVQQSMSNISPEDAKLFKAAKTVPLPEDSRFIAWEQFFKDKVKSSKTCHNADAAAVITYTGGTTGGSKGAMLSNRAVIAVAQQYIIGERELRRESTWMQVLPLFIAYGVTCSLMIPLVVGMTLIVRMPMTESIADFYKKYKANHIVYGPAYWEAFADANEDLDLSGLIAPVTGGDVLHAETERKINDYLQKHGSKHLLMNGYGMTEVGAAVSVNYTYAHEFGSVGLPFVKNVISAFDIETGQELKYGERGEICIQTPSIMLGYVNNPEETANIIRKHDDGKLWVHSGDIGYVTEDGFVHISGRLKRYMLHIANGMQKKIYSLDIEKVLLAHPYVDNCAVVPISDSVTCQKPAAFIILKKNIPLTENIEKEFRTYADKHMRDIEKIDAHAEMKLDFLLRFFPVLSLLEEIEAYAEMKLDESYRPVKYIPMEKFPLTRVGKIDYITLEKMANGG